MYIAYVHVQEILQSTCVMCVTKSPRRALLASHHRTYYVTSSYILCHIIIQCVTKSPRRAPRMSSYTYCICHIYYMCSMFFFFLSIPLLLQLPRRCTCTHAHAELVKGRQGERRGGGPGSGGEESIRGKRRKRHANTTWTHIDAWRVWLAQCRRNGLARRGQ